ncbi:MAG: MtrB/PioB family decaheme-associated outer membrane protein [Rhodospirillaceae bacterium]|nr:MtrB/PioB family decaheme-associated outer membrane protein [Rhodospirillaceae bacterium]
MTRCRQNTPIRAVRLLIAPLLIAAWDAQAQEDSFDLGEATPVAPPAQFFLNTLEAGFGYQSDDTFHFARYGGIPEKGLFPILKGLFSGRDAWTTDGTQFWDAGGSILGTDLRDLFARYGQQGQWQIGAYYRGFTRNFTESAQTPFIGAGTGMLTLPSTWVSGNSSQRFTTLAQSLKPLELKTEWQFMGGNVALIPAGTGYELRFTFDRHKRDGLRADATAFGHEANFPVGIFFPQPVDYTTHRMNASLSYTDLRWQWAAAYELATFDNAIKSIAVPNPYSRSFGPSWPAGAFAGYPFAVAQYSLPPDNSAHRFSLSSTYALTAKTRLTGKLSHAIQKQDDPFFPYTTNPNLIVREALPRTSLDGEIRKTFLHVGLTSREWKSFDLAASYTFDDRDNRTARELYSYVPNEAQDQVVSVPPGISRYIRYNLPRSFTFHRAKAEVAYRFLPQTRLSLTYVGEFKSRTYQQVSQSDEHTLKAKLLSSFEIGSGWVSYSYAHRSGSEFRDDASWNASHTLNYLNASPANQSIEHPLLRTYHLADRLRHEVKSGATFDVSASLTLNGAAGLAKETYPNTTYGRQRSKSLLLDGDVSYAPVQHFSATAFYSVEIYRLAQAGYYVATTNLANPNQVWGARNKDTIHSAGVKLDWQAIPQKLKFGMGYTLSDGRAETDVQSTPFTPLAVSAALPDAREVTHNFNLRAEYNLSTDTTVKLGYVYEHHNSRDWQYESMGFAPVAQILGSGITPPRYAVHVGLVSVVYQF